MPGRFQLTTTKALLRARLRNCRLIGAPLRSAKEAVAWLGAVQAQDYAGAKWALGQRVRAALDMDVERALDEGEILRTHVLRPTWHFVLPGEVRWLLQLSARRIREFMAYYDRKLELDEATFRRSNAAIAKALQGGKHLTRDELARVLAAVRIHASGQRLGHLMMRAELDALVCNGPRRGKQFTYALLDERVPATRALAREEALAELSRRYVRSHGPCLVQDFAWWAGLTLSDAKAGIDSIASELRRSVVNGKTYHYDPREKLTPQSSDALHLLSSFDEYLVAYKDRGLVLPPVTANGLARKHKLLGNQTLVIDGALVGSWERTVAKDRVIVEVKLLSPLSAEQEESVAAAARRYARFLGLSLELMPLKKQRRAAR